MREVCLLDPGRGGLGSEWPGFGAPEIEDWG